MQDKIYNTTITIEGVEMKNNKLTLLAHDRKRYGFWTTKKDGSDSAPYLQFKSMELKQGDSVYIGYVIEPYTDARGVNREALKIINFRETNERPTQTAPQAEKPNSGQDFASSGVSGRNWEKEAYEKCCSIWAASYLQRPDATTEGLIDNMYKGFYFELFQAIKKSGEKCFNPSKLRQSVEKFAPKVITEDLPTIQRDEDPGVEDVSGIPF